MTDPSNGTDATTPAAPAPPVEVDASSPAGRELLTHGEPEEEVDAEVVPTDREWLDTNAGDLINFLELVNPRADTYPDIKDIREKLAAAPDEYVTELASALRMYQAASAQLPNWLLSSLAKLARSVLRAQGLDFPT
jgi:hypothetical protein